MRESARTEMGVEEGAQGALGVTALAERRWLEGRLTPRSAQAPPRRAGPASRDLNRATGQADPIASSPAALSDRVPSALTPRALRPQTEPPALSCSPCSPVSPGPARRSPAPAKPAASPLPRQRGPAPFPLFNFPLLPANLVFFLSVLFFFISLPSLFFPLPFVLYLSRSVGCFVLYLSPRPGCPAPPWVRAFGASMTI